MQLRLDGHLREDNLQILSRLKITGITMLYGHDSRLLLLEFQRLDVLLSFKHDRTCGAALWRPSFVSLRVPLSLSVIPLDHLLHDCCVSESM